MFAVVFVTQLAELLVTGQYRRSQDSVWGALFSPPQKKKVTGG